VILLISFCSLCSLAGSIASVDVKAINERARQEIGKRHQEIDLKDLRLKRISWSKEFIGETNRYTEPPVSISYDLPSTSVTNCVGTEKLEKRLEVYVKMDENGNIPMDSSCMQTTTVTSSVSDGLTHSDEKVTVELRFNHCPLGPITQYYSTLIGVPVKVDGSIRRVFSCRSTKELSKVEACRFIEAVLSEQGIRLIKQDDGSIYATEKGTPQQSSAP